MLANHTSVGQQQNLAKMLSLLPFKMVFFYQYGEDDQYHKCVKPTKTLSNFLHELKMGVL
jgi:hypothetical protein